MPSTNPSTADQIESTGQPQQAKGISLEAAAQQLAKSQQQITLDGDQIKVELRLQQLATQLEAAHTYFATADDNTVSSSYAAEWLLDNFYVVQQALRQVAEDLPDTYYGELPKLTASSIQMGGITVQGATRVYLLAHAYLNREECQIDPTRLRRFLTAYQQVTALTMGELWALPIMSRLALLEVLAQAASRLAHLAPASTAIAIPPMTDLPDEELVARVIPSLRALDSQSWLDFFEDVSLVHKTLCTDPVQVYGQMDFATRDRCREAIETLARATDIAEVTIAATAIRLAQANWDRHLASNGPVSEGQHDLDEFPRDCHVGYYLVDRGRAELEAQIDYRPRGFELLRRWLLRWPTPIYLGATLLLTLGLAGLALWYTHLAGGSILMLALVLLLVLIPASTVALNLLNSVLTRLIAPRLLPKMDFSAGVPAKARTMVVVPALLSHHQDIESLCRQLELHYLRNADDRATIDTNDAPARNHITFALLTDFSDAPAETMPEDQALIAAATTAIKALNAKYTDQPFYLFHRRRLWNESEKVWMGWERKRGKLQEFNRLLRGDKTTTYAVQIGHPQILPAIRYVITLDADTLLPRGEAQRLIGTLAHPLNRAHFDATGKVVAGYTILQPRTEIKPTSSNKSLFARIFGGDTGFDLYTRAVSDLYQDLFGAGIFVGKGIYDVDTFERSVAGRVPENTILSHDLFEGIHGRAALVTDVVLYEDYPPHYLVNVLRSHRWVRGDWQLLPWLFARVPADDGAHGIKMIPNDLALIDRWKIFDNLRRSLLSPLLLLLLVAGWILLPGAAWAWTLVAVVVPSIPLLAGGIHALVRLIQGDDPQLIGADLRNQALRWLLFLAFLPYESLLLLDAIITTIVRLYLRRRRLLRWVTAERTARLFGDEMTIGTAFSKMLPSLFFVTAVIFLILWVNPRVIPIAAPLLALWLFAWWIVHTISFPEPFQPLPLSLTQRQTMRLLARRTWLFYEHFVGPDDNWLPPDHFQEAPNGVVAHRTSPTNTGMYLLSALAAYDLGYLGAFNLAARIDATFETLERLERYRGHFWNWIDTRSLAPLPPRYVSTVDSGNLAGALVAVKQGCLELIEEPIWRWVRWQGLLDLLALLDEAVTQIVGDRDNALRDHLATIRAQIVAQRADPMHWPALLQTLTNDTHQMINEQLMATLQEFTDQDGDIKGMDAETLHICRIYAERIQHHLEDMQRDVRTLLPWLALMAQPPALFLESNAQPAVRELWSALQTLLTPSLSLSRIVTIASVAEPYLALMDATLDVDRSDGAVVEEARRWLSQLQCALKDGGQAAAQFFAHAQDLAERAEQLIIEMDFSFLFNSHRQVFHIGYNIDAGELDNNFYDLLASEARIASLIAIAKRDVPQSHWLHLGRPITQVGDGERVLLSWSGTMFEYLMPPLLLRGYRGTLLDQSCRGSVEQQIAVGHQRKKPWGASESGVYLFDAAQNYQYRAFGAPGLGFKRGLEEDQVVAPYASLLAIAYRPQAVWQNLQALQSLGMMGRYGFYEAIDFTTAHLTLGQEHAIVRSYMAHHQGMILVALLNYLQDQQMVKRFHRDPRIQSVDLLLQEGLPVHAPLQYPHQEEGERVVVKSSAIVPVDPWSVPVDTPMPLVHYLSNGAYSLLINNTGGGFSRYKDLHLTRWRADTTLDQWGSWLYLQEIDQTEGALPCWSATRQPLNVLPDHEEVIFHPHMAEFRRRDRGITLHMEVTIAPTENVEIRRITLTNDTAQARKLRLTSYGEVVLGPNGSDERHPAFAKIFIESEYVADVNGLLFRRRPRAAEEQVHFLAHTLVVAEGMPQTGAYESDRARFLGRGNDTRQPQALVNPDWLTGTIGATLDPVMALGQEVTMEPHATVRLALLTVIAETRTEVLALTTRFQRWSVLNRAFQEARTIATEELRELGLIASRLEMVQRLLSLLLYPHPRLRAAPEILTANRKGQSALWAYGISGDYPILLVRIRQEEEGDLLQEVLRAHRYWRRRGLQIDVVILNYQHTNYGQPVQGLVQRIINHTESNQWLNRRGGIFVLREDQLSSDDRLLIQTTARVVLDAASGSLRDQLSGLLTQPIRLPLFEPSVEYLVAASNTKRQIADAPVVTRPTDLQFDNGYGGFSPDGKEYVIYHQPGESTPAPWINVIANADFGTLVSESGGGYTWSINSGENRLTAWHNDPVTDAPAEVLYLRDEQTADLWTPTPQPAPAAAPYLVRHGAGYSVFEHESHGLKQYTHIFVAPDAPVKVVHLRLENRTAEPRRITATYYADMVLGVNRSQSSQYLVPDYEDQICALLFRNPYSADFGSRVAFVAGSTEPHGVTTDRTEFLGRLGTLRRPAALGRIGLSGRVQSGLDPCAALQLHIDLPPTGVKEIYFLVGQGADRQEAIALVKRFQEENAIDATWQAARAKWDEILGTVTVETPDAAMNLLLNRWLLYQALSCRIWGRSALYQSSGAYGFRDQLQDAMALIHARPDLVREQILRAARHQFEAGDVLHWWHPPAGQGVRTRITDDLLWLPYVTAHYVAATGDRAILHEELPFLQGAPLAAEEEERYAQYAATEQLFTLYEHCLRALRKGTTTGLHGIPLIGTGDWNDGMNRVGIAGTGESIWLGWFLYATQTAFAKLCDQMDDGAAAQEWRRRAAEMSRALEEHGWDGGWYRRAYYDDGTPLGSAQNRECRIDSIAQSWAVIAGAADPGRARQAMQSVLERLVKWDERLILLFTPPFDKTPKDPGYIKGYLPGIRENGGQYTHAALWAIWAFAELGDGDTAGQLFTLINPILRADTAEKAGRYRVEPYVIAADVYGVAPHQGRGGWTWYTGSSGWMYRLGIEAMLGLHRVAGGLRIAPCLPNAWPGFRATYHLQGDTYQITVQRDAALAAGTVQITLDGNEVAGDLLPLVADGGNHEVVVQIGGGQKQQV